jgi:hypothetical protein
LCFAWYRRGSFFFFLVHMKRYNHDGMIDYENSDGVMDDEELEGDHRRFFFPTFLLLFFPPILSLFNVSFCLKATTGFVCLIFKFQVDRKKTLRMMKATTLTFRNKSKTYPTWLTLRKKIKTYPTWLTLADTMLRASRLARLTLSRWLLWAHCTKAHKKI